ncbi:MAG: phosphonate metabolism protein PhnP [Oceanospirillaceae bacterium]
MPSIEILGSGNASQVPQWGCDCAACCRAKLNSYYKRRPCSLCITTDLGVTMIDAGRTDLAEHYDFADVKRFVLTHFHMDHVQGLFHLRWANSAQKIPVYRPNDVTGTDDLYKHSGCLDFQSPWQAFKKYNLGDMQITALPLIHSKPTFGYFIELANTRIAYLTDTVGLPAATEFFLQQQSIDYCFLDCSDPPRESSRLKPELAPSKTPKRNHNDFTLALTIIAAIKPKQTILTHISHQFDCWLMQHSDKLPKNFSVAVDHQKITI